MKKLLLITSFLLVSLLSWAQVPANDNCNTAQNLGTLPTPAACPSGVGAAINVVGTNIGATAPSPYTTLLGCQTGGNQPGPALDVWYSFVASGNQVNINITPGTAPFLPSPAITLWTGTCGALVGFNCDNNGTATGNNSVLFQPTTPGQTYYIQVSGMNNTAAGNFNMSVSASNDCNNCLQIGNLTVSPAPVGGTYPPNTTVTFCYHITSYTQVSANWLHGLTYTFGCGWDLTTLTTTPPPSCSGSGYWAWYNSWTSSANSSTWGPGFAFNYNLPADANPGNNYGDNCSTPNWNFCITLKTKSTCTPGCTNLNMSINTSGDGESGSWTSVACTGDPNVQFAASMSCCTATATGVNPTCFGGTNGSATATPGPLGVGPFTYSWSTVPVQTTQTATNLSAGTYTVTITDFNGCVSTATVTLTNPPAMTAPITSTNVTCFGGNNGSAIVNPTGSTGPYTYSWNTVPVQTTQTATNLPAGTYTVTVTSALGCTKTNTVTITQPTQITVTTTTVNATCSLLNGSATANPVGGVGPYTYSWNTVPVQTTQTASGLGAGVYTVTVTGVGGCTATATATVSSTGSISATASGTNVSCNGGTNGSATVTPTGGGPYTYSWNTTPVQTTSVATGLPAGSYTVTVNSSGCIATATVTITQPPLLTATNSQTNVTCFGGNNGSASATPAGGVGPYTYSWNTVPVQTTSTAVNLISGTYNVTVTDANGCTTIASANITQPTALTLTLGSSTNPTCFGSTNGSITVTANGGTGSYLYSINSGPNQVSPTFTGLGANSYTVVVTDANGCTANVSTTLTQPTAITATSVITNVSCNGGNNGQITLAVLGGTGPYSYSWSNGGTTNPLTGLVAGTYSVTVTDANGCTLVLTNLTVTQPSPLTVNPSALPPTICIGQNSTLNSNPNGGTAPYTFFWTNGSTTQNTVVNPSTTTSYTVQVTDAHGCTATGSVTVTVNPPLTGSATATPPTICMGSSSTLNATVNGGTGGPYSYTWSPGGGSGSSITVSPSSTTTYTVTMSDGCSPNITATVTVTVNPSPVVTYTTTGLSGCEPLTVTYTNTTPNSSNCVWNINGIPYNSCVVTQTFPVQGTYTANLTVTDVNGCTSTGTNVTANVYPIPTAAFNVTPPVVNIMEPLVTFNNTSSAGSYQWNFGDGNTSTQLYPTHTYGDTGTFTVQLIVTTSHGCTDTAYGTVYISDVFSLYVPNAFTPNGDGRNETFTPVVTGYDFYEFWIFDRWGEMIYYSTKAGTPWDGTYQGKIVKEDVYVWKVHAKEKDSARHHNLVGHVTIVK
jgi:gliding motility-associated-like protein